MDAARKAKRIEAVKEKIGKKKPDECHRVFLRVLNLNYFLNGISLETVRRFRPLARLLANTFRPSFDAMRSRNPCLLIRFFRDG